MALAPETVHRRIVRDPNIMAGKPVVKGTRIPVALVLGQLARNPDLRELFAAYPHLTVADVQACLAYAHDLVEAQHDDAGRRSTVTTPEQGYTS
ncbi:MAG TPA: DUF433 domain-containing protein [Thermomicrobiales bacterium]|nr:DUF433 domain-containing protein [Thermomicrobiales bacterium]